MIILNNMGLIRTRHIHSALTQPLRPYSAHRHEGHTRTQARTRPLISYSFEHHTQRAALATHTHLTINTHNSVNSQHIETPSPRYHTIETVSVPRTREYRKRPNQFMSNHLIDVQQIKNVYNTQKQLIKLGLLNIRSLSTKSTFCKWFD